MYLVAKDSHTQAVVVLVDDGRATGAVYLAELVRPEEDCFGRRVEAANLREVGIPRDGEPLVDYSLVFRAQGLVLRDVLVFQNAELEFGQAEDHDEYRALFPYLRNHLLYRVVHLVRNHYHDGVDFRVERPAFVIGACTVVIDDIK